MLLLFGVLILSLVMFSEEKATAIENKDKKDKPRT